jgi:exopolyphosphatase/pppGpp-phosphohydrolase
MSDGRLAAIDIGSNIHHMIVVRRQRGNRLTHVVEKS